MERLLKLDEIAELMGTSKNKARSALSKYGLSAIDFGRGRSGGLRWLQSSVVSVMQSMSQAAQKKLRPTKPPKQPSVSIFDMSIDDVYNLTQSKNLQ